MPGCWRGQQELTLVKGSRDARMLERTARTYPGEGVEGCEDVGEDSENLPW